MGKYQYEASGQKYSIFNILFQILKDIFRAVTKLLPSNKMLKFEIQDSPRTLVFKYYFYWCFCTRLGDSFISLLRMQSNFFSILNNMD